MLKKIKFSMLALVVVACFSFSFVMPNTLRDWMTYEKAQIKIWFPDTWEVTLEDGDLHVTSPDEDCEIYAYIVEAKDLESAMEDLGEEIKQYVTDVKIVGTPKEVKINGLDAISIDAKGKSEGKDYDLGLIFVITPNGKIMVLFGEGTPASMKKNQADIAKILQSVKKG